MIIKTDLRLTDKRIECRGRTVGKVQFNFKPDVYYLSFAMWFRINLFVVQKIIYNNTQCASIEFVLIETTQSRNSSSVLGLRSKIYPSSIPWTIWIRFLIFEMLVIKRIPLYKQKSNNLEWFSEINVATFFYSGLNRCEYKELLKYLPAEIKISTRWVCYPLCIFSENFFVKIVNILFQISI